MKKTPKGYERQESITVTLPRIMCDFIRGVARQDKTTAADVVGELIQNAMIRSFEEAKLVDVATGRRALVTGDQRDRHVLSEMGLDRVMVARDVREARHTLGLTQKQLADKLNVDVMTVSRWERELVGVRPRHAFRLRTLVAKQAKGHQG